MKRSIRTTFIGLFIGLLAMVLLAVWAMNSFFLENYYLNDKVKILQDTYTQINAYAMEKAAAGEDIMDDLQSLYSKDGEQNEITRLIRNVNEKYNITVVIVDSTNDETYPSFWDGRLLADRVQQYILGKRGPKTETLVHEENYTIEKSFDKHAKSFYLQNWGFFEDNKTIFIMSMPIASIHESVDLSNRFMVYIGLIALAAGSIIMYFAGKKITSPILSLAALSERMSELDFDARYTGDSEDEIGVLGNSMNTLSEKLKETIGELKTANNELQKDIEEKIRIDEARKEFIANVSHELKTPIAVAYAANDALLNFNLAEDKQQRDKYLGICQEQLQRLSGLVEQILSMSMERRKTFRLHPETLSLHDLFPALIEQHKLKAGKPVEINLDIAPEDLTIIADRTHFSNILSNLIDNAIKYSPDKADIMICCRKKETEQVEISVTDHGIGIPTDKQPHIFDKFYRVPTGNIHNTKGYGLGLFYVKTMVEKHGGIVTVRSEAGKGSTFTIRI